jgi:adenylate cyclase
MQVAASRHLHKRRIFMNHKPLVQRLLWATLIFLLSFLLALSQALYSFDRLFSDPLYQSGSIASNRTKIIAIDEKTIQAYGDVSGWSREIPARLVEILNADDQNAPAVTVFDMLYVSARDPEGDLAFAQACLEAGNVVTALNVVHRQEVSLVDGSITVDSEHISMIEAPYTALQNATRSGFANAYMDRDGVLRYAKLQLQNGEKAVDSLALAAYRVYSENIGTSVTLPKTKNGFFAFSYTAKGGDGFEVLSLCDVLDGKIPPAAFRDCAVFVGAYAPGMQDAYSTPIDRSNPMYGVEIHASIFKALTEQKTAVPVSAFPYAVIVALLSAGFYLLIAKRKIVFATIALCGCTAICIALPKVLFTQGIEVALVYPVLCILVIYVVKLILGYVLESIKKQRVINAFKKYVAPQVVDELAKKDDFSISLGGEKRHVAVLFVDIRGFTPMSEGLMPEEVVEILNEYLNLTTNAIFKNKGTLDKFIGDATMAIFNAPFDLDDYVFLAVCTAMDIAKGSNALDAKLQERFGRSVSFGIGVHCGDAVVGNIGCEHRMDFTAIGDTVNTAARLESNAARGQILISKEVYEHVKDRVDANAIGAIPLKGKSQEVFVYQLNEIKTEKRIDE